MLQARRPRRLRQAPSARTVRRHEAARLDRARPGAGPAGAADGRAVRRARRADPHDHGRRAAAHLGRDRQDRRVRHPQPDRSRLSRRRGAGDVGASRPHRRSSAGRRCRARAPTRCWRRRVRHACATASGGTSGNRREAVDDRIDAAPADRDRPDRAVGSAAAHRPDPRTVPAVAVLDAASPAGTRPANTATRWR